MPHRIRAHIHEHHVTPFRVLLGTFLGLVGLTIFTVVTAAVDLGPLNVPLALTIAGTKAVLVVLFFMALKYDNQVNTLILSVGLVMVLVFISFTLFDTAFRGDISNVDSRTIGQIERANAAALGVDTAPGSQGETAAAGHDEETPAGGTAGGQAADPNAAAVPAVADAAPDPLVLQGQRLYAEKACNACHSLDGTQPVGPSFKGLYGRQEQLADGSTVTVDDAYLVESIKEPNAKVVEGFAPVMPPLPLADNEVAALVAYIRSLAE